MKISEYTLGLDMGVASLGWAVISTKEKLIDSGVRIFPAGIDKFGTGKDTHLNQERRKARGARRRVMRKAKRKELIREILRSFGWIPSDPVESIAWENLDVYELRSRALHDKISLPEFSRILLHLNQRRGFLSLRKSEVDAAEGDDKKKLEGMLGEIESLQDAIDSTFTEASDRTLGNYLNYLRKKDGGDHGNLIRLRARHIRREMLHHEFSLIWAEQSKHHAELTDALRYGTHGKQENPTVVVKPIPRNKSQTILQQFGLENLTFFQRRVYWPTSSIGKCELEKDELRAPIADRRFQEFRMLSELNNLRLIDNSTEGKPTERKLSPAERKVAITYLSSTQKPTLKALKGKIAKLPESPTASQVTFNLEQDKRDNIGGLPTELKLAKAFGTKDWAKLSDDQKNQIVQILTMPEPGASKVIQRTDSETKDLLLQIPTLNDPQIESLLRVSLPAGYCNFSIKALEKLLPHIRKGFNYLGKTEEDSALHLARYKRRDESSNRLLKKLPLLTELTNPKLEHYDPDFPYVNNPLVLRSLHELRKVVNGVIGKHGPPSRIHLEMARDLKMSAKQREEHAKKNNEHKKSRELAATKLEENGIAPTRDAILLYRLWDEQQKHCIYSGKPISFKQLVSGHVDIDHIYPRRANDDSYMNKVVCFRKENEEKGDRIPSEWLGETSEKFQELTERVASLPYGKRKRLLADKIPDGFANRDATDTAYMTRVARHYLTYLVEKDHQVFCTKGKHTAFLRKQWGLNSLIRNDLIELKNRDDHRHHALDAIVIAACDPSLLQKISRELKFENKWKNKTNDQGQPIRIYRLKPIANTISPPWSNFSGDADESINSIWVSHRASRKVSGPLHEETNYGATNELGCVVRRKSVDQLTEGEIHQIRDDTVRKTIKDYAGDHLFVDNLTSLGLSTDEVCIVLGKNESATPKTLSKLKPTKSNGLSKERIVEIKKTLSEAIASQDKKRLYRDDLKDKKIDQGDIVKIFSGTKFLTLRDISRFTDIKLKKQLTDKINKKKPLQDAKAGRITLPSGIPVKKVRVTSNRNAAVPLRATNPKELVLPGNTHHVNIFSLGEDKYHFEVEQLLSVSRRMAVARKHGRSKSVKQREIPIYNTELPANLPEAEFMFSLSHGDCIMTEKDGVKRVFVFLTIAATSKQMEFCEHTDARESKYRKTFTCYPNSFADNFPNALKISILPNGEVRNF